MGAYVSEAQVESSIEPAGVIGNPRALVLKDVSTDVSIDISIGIYMEVSIVLSDKKLLAMSVDPLISKLLDHKL